jgi:hypothetical protein
VELRNESAADEPNAESIVCHSQIGLSVVPIPSLSQSACGRSCRCLVVCGFGPGLIDPVVEEQGKAYHDHGCKRCRDEPELLPLAESQRARIA